MGIQFEKLKKLIFQPTDRPITVKQGRVRGNKNIFKVGLMVATCECAHSTAHGPLSVVEQEPTLDETSTQSMFHEDDIYPLVLELHHGLDVQTSMLGMPWSLGQQSFGTSIGLLEFV